MPICSRTKQTINLYLLAQAQSSKYKTPGRFFAVFAPFCVFVLCLIVAPL